MKTYLTAGLAGLMTLVGGAVAGAADLHSPRLLPPAPLLPAYYSWTGFYVGAQLGYAWGSDRTRPFDTATRIPTGGDFRYSNDSVLGGGHAGFNYQLGSVVLGIEGDIEAVNLRGGFNDAEGSGHAQRDWQASLRGRIGYAFDQVLVYATGGASFTEFDYRYFNPVVGFGENAQISRTGWNAGLGVNYALTDNLILGAEYRYTDFGTFSYVGRSAFARLTADQEPNMHTLRASIAYKF